MHEKYAMQFLGLFYALEYVQEQYRSDTYRRTQIKVRNKIKPETARKTIPQRISASADPLRYCFSEYGTAYCRAGAKSKINKSTQNDEGIKKMNIGQRIVAARKNAGMAQFELAEIANIRYNTIARIENGTLEPRLDLLEQIADILQVPLSVLLFGDETVDINITSRTLGWRIRMLRKESRMTQPELAQKAGISLTMLRQWELHPANPTISALEKIAEVFHISLKKLLTDTSKNKQSSINIGAKIAYARERAKLSQNDLAKKLNVTSAVIGKWETNRVYPKFNILEQIANALGISVLSLISGEAASNQPKPENYASPKINTEFDEVISELIIANDRLADRIWEARNRGNDDYARRITVVQNQINTAISCLEVFRGADWIRK